MLSSLKFTLSINILTHFLSLKNQDSHKQDILDAKKYLYDAIENQVEHIDLQGNMAMWRRPNFHRSSFVQNNLALNNLLKDIGMFPELEKPFLNALQIGFKMISRSFIRKEWINTLKLNNKFYFMNGPILLGISALVFPAILVWLYRLTNVPVSEEVSFLTSAFGATGIAVFGLYAAINYWIIRNISSQGPSLMKAIKNKFRKMKKCSENLKNVSSLP